MLLVRLILLVLHRKVINVLTSRFNVKNARSNTPPSPPTIYMLHMSLTIKYS